MRLSSKFRFFVLTIVFSCAWPWAYATQDQEPDQEFVVVRATDPDRASAIEDALMQTRAYDLLKPQDQAPEEATPIEIESYSRYMPRVKADEQSGKVGVLDVGQEYSYETKAFGKLPVEFSLGQRYIGLKNSTQVDLPAHLVEFSTGIEATVPFLKFDKTYLRLNVNPSFYGDDWDFHSSSFRIPTMALFIYKPNDKWIFVAGVGVYPDFEDEVAPIAGFIYRPNEKLTFNITPDSPSISYALNDKITVFTEGDATFGEFEITKANRKNVVLKYEEMHLGAGLEYNFNKYIQASMSAGGIFNRQIKYRDDSGKVKLKDGVYSEFRFTINM